MQNVSINDPEVEPVQQPVQVDSSDLILDSMIKAIPPPAQAPVQNEGRDYTYNDLHSDTALHGYPAQPTSLHSESTTIPPANQPSIPPPANQQPPLVSTPLEPPANQQQLPPMGYEQQQGYFQLGCPSKLWNSFLQLFKKVYFESFFHIKFPQKEIFDFSSWTTDFSQISIKVRIWPSWSRLREMTSKMRNQLNSTLYWVLRMR